MLKLKVKQKVHDWARLPPNWGLSEKEECLAVNKDRQRTRDMTAGALEVSDRRISTTERL